MSSINVNDCERSSAFSDKALNAAQIQIQRIIPKQRRCAAQRLTRYLCIFYLVAAAATVTVMAQQKSKPRGRNQPDSTNSANPSAAADRIIERFMNEKHVPGLVLAVVRNGQVVVEKGYGVRSTDDKQPPDSNTLFYIGSLSKALTAVGIELLVEQGKLNLDEPTSRYIKGLPKSWQPIPLKFFLAHQSGIPDIASAQQPTFQAELRSIDNKPLSFEPGVKQQYNNFNFVVAGQVIEEVSGRPYLEFMKEEVFKPLGMTRSGYHQSDPNSAPGYFLRNGKLDVVNDVAPKGGEYVIPSGFLQTTLGDLLRLYWGIQRHKLLPLPRTREMLSPITTNKTGTPGWFARKVNGVTIVIKDGAASGYSSQFQFAPERGDAVIFIMNLQGQALGTATLANDLLREVCGLPLPQ